MFCCPNAINGQHIYLFAHCYECTEDDIAAKEQEIKCWGYKATQSHRRGRGERKKRQIDGNQQL